MSEDTKTLRDEFEAVAKAFLYGSRFTQTGYGTNAVEAFNAYLNGIIPGDEEELAEDEVAFAAMTAAMRAKSSPALNEGER